MNEALRSALKKLRLSGLLEADLQALQEPGKAKLLQDTTQGIIHERISFGWNASWTNWP
jgi:hypothetical protein